MVETLKNFINGEWVAAKSGEVLAVDNPTTGAHIANVPLSNADDVADACQAAHEAFADWRRTPVVERARYLFKFKDLLDKNRQEIAEICTKDHGKTLAESLSDIGRGIENVEHACGVPALMMGHNLEDIARGIDCAAERQPMGVFAGITPFNFPPMVPLWFIPYALATGNTYVLKASEQVPYTWQRITELLAETGLPKGVFNMVQGGREVVESICANPHVEGVSFVGSTKVARIVYESCAKTGKRVQSLGGAKNHLIIMPDAVMDRSVQNVADSAFGCAGQRCLAASVAVAVGDAYEPVRERLIKATEGMVMGDGLKAGVTLGPVISKSAKERIERYIGIGIEEGAECLVDGRGKSPEGFDGGHWVGATLFDKVKPGMRIAKEEIFGPVLSLVQVKDFDAAVELTNASNYGNATSIYTQSGKWAREYKYRAGPAMLGVNIGVASPMAMFPFGGSKDSIFGDAKAHGPASIEFFTDRKVTISRWF